ncbi:MAG: PP2C family protein-serine/threonine phosphatase [Thermodesulfobacteriota bacterium]
MNERDLELAAKLHYSFLEESYSSDFVEVSVKGRPFDSVGGDYSSILPLSKDRLMVCMCDTVGHGITSALLAARVNTFVLTHMRQNRDPCGLIDSLNSYLFERLAGTGIYTTFAVAIFDFTSMTMNYVGAAHPPLLHFKAASSKVELIKSDAIFLGVSDPLKSGCPGKINSIASGDRVILYTDGVIEIKNSEGRWFGTGSLEGFVKDNRERSVDEFNLALLEHISRFASGHFIDDMLVMSIDVK